jgi:hypothetical protein
MLSLIMICLTAAVPERSFHWESHDLMLGLPVMELAGSKANAVRLKLLLDNRFQGKGTLVFDPNVSLYSEVGNPRETTTAPLHTLEILTEQGRHLEEHIHASEPDKKVKWIILYLEGTKLLGKFAVAFVADDPSIARLLVLERSVVKRVIPLRLVTQPASTSVPSMATDESALHLTVARIVKRDDVERTLTISTLSRTPFMMKTERSGNIVRPILDVGRQPYQETLHHGFFRVLNRHGEIQRLESVWPKLQQGMLLFRLDGHAPLSPEAAALLSPDAMILQRR